MIKFIIDELADYIENGGLLAEVTTTLMAGTFISVILLTWFF